MKDYKKELNKLKEHRKLYKPAMEKMLGMYNERGNNPREITDEQDLPIILELIDIEYIDADAVRVKKNHGVVNRVHYTGEYPLTDAGKVFMKSELQGNKSSYLKIALIFAVLIILSVIIIFIL